MQKSGKREPISFSAFCVFSGDLNIINICKPVGVNDHGDPMQKCEKIKYYQPVGANCVRPPNLYKNLRAGTFTGEVCGKSAGKRSSPLHSKMTPSTLKLTAALCFAKLYYVAFLPKEIKWLS